MFSSNENDSIFKDLSEQSGETLNLDPEKSPVTTKETTSTTIESIADSFQNVENFLKEQGIPEEEIKPVKESLEYLDMDESVETIKQKGYNMSDFYTKIVEPRLLERYSILCQDNETLSMYWINKILNSKNEVYISCIYFRLANKPEEIEKGITGLNKEEVRELLNKLIDFYDVDYKQDLESFSEEYYNVHKGNLVELQKMLNGEVPYKQLVRGSFSYPKGNIEEKEISEGDIRDFLSNWLEKKENGGSKGDIEDLQHKIIHSIIFVPEDKKLSDDLFYELSEHPDFYWSLIMLINKFEIGSEDHKVFFDQIIKEDSLDRKEKHQILEHLKDYIDNFKGLDDQDYINLYQLLHCKGENVGYKKDLDYCANNNFSGMREDELRDYIDLIKTTSFWTDDLSKKCYNEAVSKGMWDCILRNYAMGYFSSATTEKDLFDQLCCTKNGYYYIRHNLPIFNQKIIGDFMGDIMEHVDQNTLYGICECNKWMKNRSKKPGERGSINGK